MEPQSTMKRCPGCGQIQPLSAYYRNARNHDGLQSRCKQCIKDYGAANAERIREKARQWALSHPERVKANASARDKRAQQRKREEAQQRTEKRCKVCGQTRAISEFPERTAFRDGRSATCNDCRARQGRETKRRWEQRNPAKRREGTLRRRARIKQLRVGKVDYERIYARDSGICYLCGLPVTFEACHFDHVIPLSRGGAHSEANIAVAHARCNQTKSDKLVTYQQGTLL